MAPHADEPGPGRAFPYGSLLLELTSAEFKLRDQGTVFGFLWTLLQPALMFTVLYALFIRWLGKYVDQYGAYLLIGIVLWNFFQKATSNGLTSLRRRQQLIRNYRFPRELIVLSAVGAVFLSTMLELLVLLPFLVAMGLRPSWSWLLVPAPIAALLAFSTGVAMMLAVLAAEFHDAERIWEVLTTALFYLTPVFYPLSVIEPVKRAWLARSPLTMIIAATRSCLMGPAAAQPSQWTALAATSLLALAAGWALLRRREMRIADALLA